MKRVLIASLALCMLLCLVGCGSPAKEVEIIAYVDEELPEAEARAIGTELNAMAGLTSVTFVTKEEALEKFLSHQEDPSDFAGVDTSMLQYRYTISAKTRNVKALVSAIEEIDGIEDVSYFIIK